MGRIRSASDHFSSARRNLIELSFGGGPSALIAAVRDAVAGLKALDRVALTSASATANLEALRSMLPLWGDEDVAAEVVERLDRLRFAGAVDDLASWLYFSGERAR